MAASPGLGVGAMQSPRSSSDAPHVRSSSSSAHSPGASQPDCSSPASVGLGPLTTDAAAAAPLNSPAFVPRLSPQAEISSLDLGTSLSASASSIEDSAEEMASRPQPQPTRPPAAVASATTASSSSSSGLKRQRGLDPPPSSKTQSSGDVSKRELPPHLDSIEALERRRSPVGEAQTERERTSTDDGSSAGIDGAAFPPPPRRGVDSPTWRKEQQSPRVDHASAARSDRKPGTWRLRNGSHPTRPALQSQDHLAHRRQQESTQDLAPLEGRLTSLVDSHSSSTTRSGKRPDYSTTLADLGSRGDGDGISELSQTIGSSCHSGSSFTDAEHATAAGGQADRQRLRALTMSSVPLPHPSTLPRPTLAGPLMPAMQPPTRASDVFAKMAGAGPPSPYPPPGSSSTFSSTESLLSSRRSALGPAPPPFGSTSFPLPFGDAGADASWRSRVPLPPSFRRDGHAFGAASHCGLPPHALPFSSPGEVDCTSERLARLDALRRTVEEQELALQQGYFDAETAQTQLEHFQEELHTLQQAGRPAPLSMPMQPAPPLSPLAGWPAGGPAPPLSFDGGDEAWWKEQIRTQQQYNNGGGPSPNNCKLGLYKTELCRSWEERGNCRYGSKCQFAHGNEELRPVQRHAKYKTEICRTFWRTGQCPYARRCCFIHMSPGDEPSEESKTDEVTRSRVPLLARVGVSNGASSVVTPERNRAASGPSPRSGDVAVSVLREAIANTPSWAEDLRRGRAHSSASVQMLGGTDYSADMPRRVDSTESLTDATSRARGSWTPGGSACGDGRTARNLSSPPASATIRLPDFASMRGTPQPSRTDSAASIWKPAASTATVPRSDDRDADFFGPLRTAFEQRGAHAASTTSASTPRSTSGSTHAAPWSLWRQQASDDNSSRRSSRWDEAEVHGLGLGLSGVSLRDRSSSNATTSSAPSLDRESFGAVGQTRSSPPTSPSDAVFGLRRNETSKATARPQQARRAPESALNTPGSTRTSTTLSSDSGSPWTPFHARELGADIAFSDRETTPPKPCITSDEITFGDSSEESFRSTAGASRANARFDHGVFFADR